MKIQFRAKLTPEGVFIPQGETWQRWKLANRGEADKWFMFSPRKEGPPRKLNQNNLYWVRNEVLSCQPEVSLSKDGVHEWLMREAGYGTQKTLKGRTIFDRESSADLTVEEFSRLMKEQDKLAEYCNEGREPQHYCELPTTENR